VKIFWRRRLVREGQGDNGLEKIYVVATHGKTGNIVEIAREARHEKRGLSEGNKVCQREKMVTREMTRKPRVKKYDQIEEDIARDI